MEETMIEIDRLEDSTSLIGDAEALRKRYEDQGVLFLRGVMDRGLLAWAELKYRAALAEEGLIAPDVEAPLWTGKHTDTWRPCDAIGTTVWHKVVQQPLLNQVMHDIFDADPVWLRSPRTVLPCRRALWRPDRTCFPAAIRMVFPTKGCSSRSAGCRYVTLR
jgi:hypothetical protein